MVHGSAAFQWKSTTLSLWYYVQMHNMLGKQYWITFCSQIKQTKKGNSVAAPVTRMLKKQTGRGIGHPRSLSLLSNLSNRNICVSQRRRQFIFQNRGGGTPFHSPRCSENHLQLRFQRRMLYAVPTENKNMTKPTINRKQKIKKICNENILQSRNID
jgi:hypothetical protein